MPTGASAIERETWIAHYPLLRLLALEDENRCKRLQTRFFPDSLSLLRTPRGVQLK